LKLTKKQSSVVLTPLLEAFAACQNNLISETKYIINYSFNDFNVCVTRFSNLLPLGSNYLKKKRVDNSYKSFIMIFIYNAIYYIIREYIYLTNNYYIFIIILALYKTLQS